MKGLIMARARRQHPPPPEDEHVAGCAAFVTQLLDLLDEELFGDEARIPSELRDELEQTRIEAARATEAEELARFGTASIDLSRRYLAARRNSETEREDGLRKIIDLLRETLATLAADSGTFTASVTSASDRVRALVGVTDIRVLKDQLIREV